LIILLSHEICLKEEAGCVLINTDATRNWIQMFSQLLAPNKRWWDYCLNFPVGLESVAVEVVQTEYVCKRESWL
jgi:hypothetical protein